jgi:hypothetical protein
MDTKFEPDFGLFAKQHMPNAVQSFYSLSIDHIARVGKHLYSLNFNYLYKGVEYALTLDFDSSDSHIHVIIGTAIGASRS